VELIESIEEYFEDIDLTPTVKRRMQLLAGFAADVLSEGVQFEQAFLSEYVNSDGTRTYENGWLFAGDLWIELHNLMTEENIDYARVSSDVKYAYQKRTKYRHPQFSPESRLTINFATFGGVRGELKASGSNCKYLHAIFKDRILPELSAGSTFSDSPVRPDLRGN
jgi:hypothetical protein